MASKINDAMELLEKLRQKIPVSSPSSQCKAIYYDKSGKERWEELEHHYEEIEERYREQLEDSYDTDEC